MPRPAVATFVEDFFTRMLFQGDDVVSASTVSGDIAPDAEILINGDSFTQERLSEANVLPFRATFTGKLQHMKDLNIRSLDGVTGLAAQHADFIVNGKEDEEKIQYHATTLVRVGAKEDGGQWVTGMWVVMGPEMEEGAGLGLSA